MKDVAKIFCLAGAGLGWISGILYLCDIPDFPWIFGFIAIFFGAVAAIFAFTDWFFDWMLSNKKEVTQVEAFKKWAVAHGMCPYCEHNYLIGEPGSYQCTECERVYD